MAKTNITFTPNTAVINNIKSKFQLGNRNLAQSIVTQGVRNAPVDTGALRMSGRVEQPKTDEADAVFGGGDVPYAKRRHFENKKNPQTLLYLSRAAEDVAKDVSRYYKI